MLKEIIDLVPHLNKAFTLAFSQTLLLIKARSLKLCMVITFLGVYIVIVGLITLILFQGHRCVRNTNCKLHVLDFCPV